MKRVTDFAQHALAGGAQDLSMQHFAVLAREETRKLRQPGRRFCRQDPDERLSLRAAAQSSQRIEHRTVGFLASISFDALPTGDVNGPLTHRDLALEIV